MGALDQSVQNEQSGDIDQMVNFQDNAQAEADADLVRATLRSIMRDPNAPAAAKAQAARTMAEMEQLLGRNQRDPVDPTTPVRELTRADLEAELRALEGG